MENPNPFIWQMIKEAIEVLNRIVTNSEIRNYIHKKWGDVKDSSINAHIALLTVNKSSRINWPENQKPRLSNSNNKNDLLFTTDRGQVVRYNPEEHGIWEIFSNESGKFSVRQLTNEGAQASINPNYWIFQGNPDKYDIIGALRDTVLKTWTVSAHKEKIKTGDKVILWVTGSKSGCYALLTVTSEIVNRSDFVEEESYYRDQKDNTPHDRVEVEVEFNLWENPILKNQLLTQSAFSKFKEGNQGTNFEASKEEYQTILTMIDNRTGDVVPSIPTHKFPLNIILYGPPGTGKTYETIDLSVEIIDGSKSPDHSINKKRFDDLRTAGQIEFITFHQNYAYEDFVVGIRPDPNSEELHFIPHKGIFYRICEQARDNYLASRPGQQTQISFDDALAAFIKPVVEEDKKVDIIMPSGKHFNIYEVTDRSIKFEKSTGNTSHTLSINTLKELENGNREMMISGLAAYYQPLIEAIRKKRLIQGNTTPRKRYVLIIDEINRANISRVFGELITLLEDDKRLGGDNELKVMLPNGERNFSIPPNLFVIGTMNTADKSIALLDIALRRRFEFKAIYPDTSLIPQTAREKIIRLNQEIRLAKKSPDYMIGHAFFIGKTDSEIIQVMNAKVIPLLYEYFNGRESFVKDILVKAGFEIQENPYTFQWEVK